MNMDYENAPQERTHTAGAATGAAPSQRRTNGGKGGRYLKKEQPKSAPHHPQRRRRRRRRLNPRFVILVTGLLAVLIGIVLCVRSCTKPTIIGLWDMDGTTGYRFEKDGTGAVVLPTTEYAFNYSIEGNILRIDFISEEALDANYTFQVEKNALFLTGGPGDAKTTYALKRK